MGNTSSGMGAGSGRGPSSRKSQSDFTTQKKWNTEILLMDNFRHHFFNLPVFMDWDPSEPGPTQRTPSTFAPTVPFLFDGLRKLIKWFQSDMIFSLLLALAGERDGQRQKKLPCWILPSSLIPFYFALCEIDGSQHCSPARFDWLQIKYCSTFARLIQKNVSLF